MSAHLLWSTSINADEGEASDLLQQYSSKKHRAQVASSLGLEGCIQNCQRQAGQAPSKTTLSSALSAIVGALWVDCGNDFFKLELVVQAMGCSLTLLQSCQCRANCCDSIDCYRRVAMAMRPANLRSPPKTQT